MGWEATAVAAVGGGRGGHRVYVLPEGVVEIRCNEVKASQRDPGGVALRFARVKRYRTDKAAAEADTIDMVLRFAPCPPNSRGPSA